VEVASPDTSNERGERVCQLVTAYWKWRKPFSGFFSERIAALLRDLIQRGATSIHSVTCRANDPARLGRKLGRPDATYGVLSDATDLAGVCVKSYCAADVDKVA
jgi:hypothetical protein